MTTKSPPKIEEFGLRPGRVLVGTYEIVRQLGQGWEGEVYLMRELATGIARAAKFFFPHRNPNDRTAKFYARKLHKLRHCPILIQYHGRETFVHQGRRITFLVSEFVPPAPAGPTDQRSRPCTSSTRSRAASGTSAGRASTTAICTPVTSSCSGSGSAST